MAPDLAFIADTTKRYKTANGIFVTWLADAAKTCGASIDTFIGKTSSTTKTKKRKARDKIPVPELNIPTRRLVELARIVAESAKPKVTVPRIIYYLLGEVIALRKETTATILFGQAVSDSRSEHEIQDEDGHTYYVRVLEQVRDILAPLREKTPVSKQKNSTDHVQNLANIFEALDLEEPIEGPPTGSSTAATAVVPIRTTRKTSAETYNVEPTLDDFLVYSMFFFQDLDRIRALIRELWTGYRQGRTALVTATLVTNTAIELIQRNVEELFAMMAEWPHLEVPNQYEWIGAVLDYICTAIPAHFGEQSDMHNRAADFVCMPTSARIGVFFDEIRKNGSSPLGDYNQETPFIYTLFFELNNISVLGIDCPPGMDALTRAFRCDEGLSKTRNMPAWVVFGVQISLDIHEVLQQDPHKAFRELQATGERLIAATRNYFQYTRAMRNRHEKWHQDNDPLFLQTIQFISTWIKKDHIGDCLKKSKTKTEWMIPSFSLLKNHPLFCGSIIYWLNTEFQRFSIRFANTYDSILASAHVYNAAKQSKYLPSTWSDMEYIISVHKEEHIFVGGMPSQPVDYWKRFQLAFGASAANFSRNRRAFRPGDIARDLAIRNLATTNPMHDIFFDRYCGLKSRYADISGARLDALIREVVLKHSEMKDLEKEWAKHRKLTSLQLLGLLSVAVADEDLHLHFDYISMEIRCAKLYTSIREKFLAGSVDLSHILEEDQDFQALTLEGPPTNITQYLKRKMPESPLNALAVTKAIFFSDPTAAAASRSVEGFSMNTSLVLRMAGVTLERASKLMKEVIEKEAMVELSKARELSISTDISLVQLALEY